MISVRLRMRVVTELKDDLRSQVLFRVVEMQTLPDAGHLMAVGPDEEKCVVSNVEHSFPKGCHTVSVTLCDSRHKGYWKSILDLYYAEGWQP